MLSCVVKLPRRSRRGPAKYFDNMQKCAGIDGKA